jgi:thymidylate kinase
LAFEDRKPAKIGVVGPCAAGKSTLIKGLEEQGYQANHIAQEHSYVPDMWRLVANPDILIYLDVSFSVSMQRRKMDWTQEEFQREVDRLHHAQEHADFYLRTDSLSPKKVLARVLEFLESRQR